VRLIEELRESRRRIVAAQDERANKLERDIHDGAQQQLVALAVKERLAESLIGKDEERLRDMLRQLRTETESALQDLRDLARGIYPPLLADEGLAAALGSQVRRSVVPVTVEADGVGRYAREVEAAVYFSVLEALQNASKYSAADHAIVALRHSDGVLSFEVADDGVGFSLGDRTSGGTGLQGMADRLDAIGGALEIRSAPGEGTTVLGRVPVG
jgi:signal transduction histidine kinase